MSLPARVEDRTPVVAGLTLLHELELAGAVTETGLNLDGIDLTYDQCEALAAMLGRVKRATSWIVGDLLAYSERKFSEEAPQIAEATGLAPQTLLNLASVSRRVAPERRRASLPHGVHAEVASLLPDEQEEWLSRAEQGDWSRSDLRAHMHAETPGGCVHEYVCRKCGELHG